MASVFGHSIVAFTFSKLIDKRNSALLILLAVISAVLPDIDVIGFNYGIKYSSVFGHRGITHSIFFAFIWSFLLTFIFGKKRKKIFFIVLFLATISHGIFDAMTTGGKGVAFFAPFENSRYFFGFRPIQVSPIGAAKFFSKWGLEVLKSEAIWIGIPSLCLLLCNKIILKFKDGKK